MVNNKNAFVIKFRGFIQFFASLLSNIHLKNFISGNLYQGKLKAVCVPGFNCYSCPGATGSCPVGAFQAVVGSSKFSFSYYITGILIFIGVMLGRFVCGFLCPFGWFQDLLHKIPSKKFSTKKLKALCYLKYAIMIVIVGILPVILVNNAGLGNPYFCKHICPQGVLQGALPISLAKPSVFASLGGLFLLKSAILVLLVVLSIFLYRPFCKWLCPLGAFYALFNKTSFLCYNVDKHKCISCGACARACKMDVDITKTPNHTECIRCGDCIKVCDKNAISMCYGFKRKEIKNENK